MPAKKNSAPAAKAKAAPAKKPAAKKGGLAERLAHELGVSVEAVHERALKELAESIGLDAPAAEAAPAAAAARKPTAVVHFPQRLYLQLDGRGLDGRGMPFEVIDLPCTVGSSKRSSVWINSPQIETNHLRITHGDEGWLLEDLNTEHGTFMGNKKIKERILHDGDEFRLAGYLRLRASLQ